MRRGRNRDKPEGQAPVPEHASSSAGAPPDPHTPLVGPSLLLWLSDLRVRVTPGQSVRLKINVRNVSAVVQTFTLTPIGPAAAWSVVVPAQISLFPGDEGSASLVIRPPKASSLAAGDYILGVKATSEVHTTDQVVGEVDITVDPYHQFKASLSRGTIDLRRSTTAFVQISNDGNSSVDFDVHVADPDGRLKLKLAKDQVVLTPGEPTWVKLQIKAPWHIIGAPITYGMVATVGAHRDLVTNELLTSVKPSVQRATLVQRPLIHLRLGFFGRMAILLAILSILAAFLVPRIINAFVPRLVTGSPIVPAGFVADLDSSNQVVLTWQPSSGATGYSIYAIGAAGNPSPTPSPSTPTATVTATVTAQASVPPTSSPSPVPTLTTSAAPATTSSTSSTPAATVPAALTDRGVVSAALNVRDVTYLRGGERKRKGTPSPSPSSTPPQSPDPEASDRGLPAIGTAPSPSSTPSATESLLVLPSDSASPASSDELATLAVPLCSGCTHVTDVAAGSTRFVITNAPPGITACYRIVATAGSAMSLYSPQACVTTPAAGSGGSGGGSASASGSGSSTGGTSAGSGGASASGSGVSTLPPCAPEGVATSAITSSTITVSWKVATSASATTSSPAGKEARCSATTVPTGFSVQRKNASGSWSDVGGPVLATASSLVVSGLTPSTKVCFRVVALSAVGSSPVSATACARTSAPPVGSSSSVPSSAAATPSSSGSTTGSPSPTGSPTGSASGTQVPTTTAVTPNPRSAPGIRIPASANSAAVSAIQHYQGAVGEARAAVAGARQTAVEAQAQARDLQRAEIQASAQAQRAQRRLDTWAAAMYTQGDVPGVLAALMGETDLTGRPGAYQRSAAGSVQDAAVQATLARNRARDVSARAAAAVRSAQVLAALAQQRLDSLRALLADAEQSLRALVPTSRQVLVGTDGCPVEVPVGTLRGGSGDIGIQELCERSVTAAATPQAALAITYALRQLGAPYACGGQGRLDVARYDCSSFVARAYSEGAGISVARQEWSPSTRNMVPWDGIALDRHYAFIAPDDLAPGDLVLYDTGGRSYRHVVMVLGDGWMVHTNACGDVAHVDRFWGTESVPGRAFLVARRVLLDTDYQVQQGDPALTPQPAGTGADVPGVGDRSMPNA